MLLASLRGERLRQLLARVDGELLVDVAQVVLDRLRAEEQRRRRLSCRLARGQQERDLQLLWGQLVERGRVAPSERLAGCRQLGAGAACPWSGAKTFERLERVSKLRPSQNSVPRAAQTLAVGQVGACSL